MSIRILTTELFAEVGEARRRGVIKKSGLQSTRDPGNITVETGDSPMAGKAVLESVKGASGNEQPVATTPQTPAVRPKKQEDRWGIPGGIKARFGRSSHTSGEDRSSEKEASKIPEDPDLVEDKPDEVYSIDIELQTNLLDFILRNREKAKHDESIIENVPLIFHEGQGALPVARFPEWTEDLNISPTAGMDPEPGEQWICTVDAAGLIYPIEKIQ